MLATMMRRFAIACALFFVTAEAFPVPALESSTNSASTLQATKLMVSISGIRNDKGQILIQLWSSPKGFLKQHSTGDRTLVAIDADKAVNGVMTTTFSVMPGSYAVSVMHDERGSGKMHTNFLGYPTQGYGLSNSAIGFMGPPSFELAHFSVLAPGRTISIVIRY